MENNNTDKINIAVIKTQLTEIQSDVKEIKNALKFNYVTLQEFEPIQKLVYGLVGLILIAVVGALLALLFKN